MNLAVGFFDGVHLGHQRILARADAALTFQEHPLAVLAPEKAPPLLMTPEERLAAISIALKGSNREVITKPGRDGARPSHICVNVLRNGRDALRRVRIRECSAITSRVRALAFTRELAAESPEEFATRLRHDYPYLEAILCGPNWRFGAGGAGDAEFLRARGFTVEVVPMETLEEAPVSSTRIRMALQAGDLQLANAMLGRPFAVTGEVAPGKGEGRELGFPTINVRPANHCLSRLLPFGAYVADTVWGRAVANWGQAPTMGARAWPTPVLEVHLIRPLTPLEPLKALTVGLLRFLRPERRFASAEELKKQIALDVFSASQSPSNSL